jgi:hypothetical protein
MTILAAFTAGYSAAQEKLPMIKSNSELVTIKDGATVKENGWRLAPDAKPDVYEADLMDGRAQTVTFVTDVESISFTVEEGKKYDFIIRWADKDCYTQIVGKRFVPAAVFDKKYQEAHRGKTSIYVPEVYEMVNIAIALTPTAKQSNNLVYQRSDYYTRMLSWFDKYKDHPLVTEFDNILKQNQNRYFSLKMNGYSFEFDGRDKIVRSAVYDRTGFSGERSNSLVAFLEKMQSFADETKFREFYRQNQKTYDEQIRFFRNTANLAEMKRWLHRNFPGSSDYDTYTIIFSPLVAYNQSVTWLESNGFKELQPHVNFPYAEDIKRGAPDFHLSPEAEVIFRGNIVFTEMNHGYINPEAEKYASRVSKAMSNRELWVDSNRGSDYYPGTAAFNEYLNWALVSLRIVDYAPKNEQAKMIAAVDKMMTERRGFPQFAELDKFLIDLYKNRKKGTTLADLYPQIIEWFEKQNAAQ